MIGSRSRKDGWGGGAQGENTTPGCTWLASNPKHARRPTTRPATGVVVAVGAGEQGGRGGWGMDQDGWSPVSLTARCRLWAQSYRRSPYQSACRSPTRARRWRPPATKTSDTWRVSYVRIFRNLMEFHSFKRRWSKCEQGPGMAAPRGQGHQLN